MIKSDDILIKEYQNGNLKSFEVLFYRHKNQLYRFILNIIRDPDLADDFFQDTWIKVINALKSGQYSEKGKFIAWVKFLSKNLIGDYFRKINRNQVFSYSYSPHLIENLLQFDFFQQVIEKSEDKEIITKLVDNLSPEQHHVIKEVVYNELTFKEYSEKNHVSINTALGRKRYAIKHLKQMYQERQIVNV